MKILTLILITAITLMSFGCDKKKALATVRQADELAAKLLIYGRNIARANNDSFRAGNVSSDLHLITNKGVDKYLQGIDKLLVGIEAAKKAITNGADASGQIDILEALFTAEVQGAAFALIDIFVTLPPELKDKLSGWGAAIQLALSSFKALFAGVRMEVQNANA